MANNTELIDRYLRNELTENEKKQFEGLLSASDKSLEGKNLNDEMELQKEIIMAIQARGLKECLQKKGNGNTRQALTTATNYQDLLLEFCFFACCSCSCTRVHHSPNG